jgi:beta-fructofuranosidase
MTLPTVRHLANISDRGYDLITTPYNLDIMYDKVISQAVFPSNGSLSVSYATLESGAVYFEVNITSKTPNATTFSSGTADFVFTASKTGESVCGGFVFDKSVSFWVDRSNIRGYPSLSDKVSIDNLGSKETWQIRAIMDRSILEVFLNEGESIATTVFFPEGRLDQMTFETKGLGAEIEVSAVVWSLKSAWIAKQGMENLEWRWKGEM